MTTDTNTTNVLQEMFDTTVSVYEAALACGVDGLTLHRMQTMMEWARELADGNGVSTASLEDVDSHVVFSMDQDVAILDAEYDEEAAWADVDDQLDVDDGDDDGEDSEDFHSVAGESFDNVIQLNAP
jgi:hypothetical protein